MVAPGPGVGPDRGTDRPFVGEVTRAQRETPRFGSAAGKTGRTLHHPSRQHVGGTFQQCPSVW